MAYSSWSVVFGEQPSAAKWNILGTNDAQFNSLVQQNGAGFLALQLVRTQLDTTNSTQSNVMVEHGWGFISTGGGGTSQLTETVTFPTAFDTLLSLHVGTIGMLSGSDPGTIIALTAASGGDVIGSAYQPTASTFVASLKLISGTFAASQRWAYSWTAFGVKA